MEEQCDHEWSFGIYGLAYRCKKCDTLPPLDVSHHVAIERCAGLFSQLSAALSRESAYREALEEIIQANQDTHQIQPWVISGQADYLESIARAALDPKPEEPVGREVTREELAKRIIREYPNCSCFGSQECITCSAAKALKVRVK